MGGLQGGFLFPFFHLVRRQKVAGAGELGIGADYFLGRRQRFVHIPLEVQRLAQVELGLVKRAVELERLFIRLDRFRIAALPGQNAAEVVPGKKAIRMKRQCGGETAFGFIRARWAGPREIDPQDVVDPEVVDPEVVRAPLADAPLADALEQFDGRVQIALRLQTVRQK